VRLPDEHDAAFESGPGFRRVRLRRRLPEGAVHARQHHRRLPRRHPQQQRQLDAPVLDAVRAGGDEVQRVRQRVSAGVPGDQVHEVMRQPPRMPRVPRVLGRMPSTPPRLPRAPRGGVGFSMTSASRMNPGEDWSRVLTDHLMSSLQTKLTVDLPTATPNSEPTDQEEDDMRPTVGSVLHYTPDSRGWLANLSDEEGSEWQEIVVGWAVVVTWAKYAPEAED